MFAPVNLFGLAGAWCAMSVVMMSVIKRADSRLNEPVELETFDYCIKTTPNAGLLQCAGQQAIASLQFLEEANNLTLAGGIMMIKDDTNPSARILPNIIDHDPLDFRGILENAGAMISQRQLMWDMGIIYPGLKLKIGPTLGANGVLEFVMDPGVLNDERSFHEEKSTARILTRNFVVPFLLGLKFNLATLLPLVFGGLILLSKKALILGKIALFVSGLFGYGSIFSPGIGLGFPYGGLGGASGLSGYGFSHRPFRYGEALHDKPDWDHHYAASSQSDSVSNHRPGYGNDHGSLGSNHHGGNHHHGSQNDEGTSGGYYKKKDKYLNLDERLESQASSLVDKFYEFEKQQMLKDRTTRLFERKFYETEQGKDAKGNESKDPSSGAAPASAKSKGDGYTFVTSDNADRSGRSLPMTSGYRNFAWSDES
ncbi:uncharacterized protein LOC129738745 [Uranotaenia lowii]|uniref:uncharacterized protein LOC129738745 n=1 Tax=Uranotaenia lowii TaxID=190385 RepID=UPI002478FDC0|nr:uncharacterized protein LOC129738745 [Uranotaenia lowii]